MTPLVQVDTREQHPLTFTAYPVERATLPAGDYGISGFSDCSNPAFIVERKSLADLIQSLTFGRDRFMREVEKLRAFRFAALVIEAWESEIHNGEFRSQVNPDSIIQSIRAIQVRAGIHVIFAGSHTGAARCVEGLVRQFVRGVEKDVARLGGKIVERRKRGVA